jgi:hypothetical protein
MRQTSARETHSAILTHLDARAQAESMNVLSRNARYVTVLPTSASSTQSHRASESSSWW